MHYLLPSPEGRSFRGDQSDHVPPINLGELAPAILATVQTASKLVDVLVVHMGNDRDDLDRKLQAEKLREIMANRCDYSSSNYLHMLRILFY